MPNRSLPASLALVGAGKMGGAMLEGWLKVGLDPCRVAVLDPMPSQDMAALCSGRGIALNPPDPVSPEVVVLATKPQVLDAAAGSVDRLLAPHTLLISILAGKTI